MIQAIEMPIMDAFTGAVWDWQQLRTGERLERFNLFSRLKHLLEYISVYEWTAEVTATFGTREQQNQKWCLIQGSLITADSPFLNKCCCAVPFIQRSFESENTAVNSYNVMASVRLYKCGFDSPIIIKCSMNATLWSDVAILAFTFCSRVLFVLNMAEKQS